MNELFIHIIQITYREGGLRLRLERLEAEAYVAKLEPT
jgi:hypothetical protein